MQKNGWEGEAKYIVICEGGNSGCVWYFCGFAVYHVLEEPFVV